MAIDGIGKNPFERYGNPFAVSPIANPLSFGSQQIPFSTEVRGPRTLPTEQTGFSDPLFAQSVNSFSQKLKSTYGDPVSFNGNNLLTQRTGALGKEAAIFNGTLNGKDNYNGGRLFEIG
jgi:hypothetical protein